MAGARNPGKTVSALGTGSNTITATEEGGASKAYTLRAKPGPNAVRYLVGNLVGSGAAVTNISTGGVVTYTEDGASRTATAKVYSGPGGVSYVGFGPGGRTVTAFASGGTVTFSDESVSRTASLWMRPGADGIIHMVVV